MQVSSKHSWPHYFYIFAKMWVIPLADVHLLRYLKFKQIHMCQSQHMSWFCCLHTNIEEDLKWLRQQQEEEEEEEEEGVNMSSYS